MKTLKVLFVISIITGMVFTSCTDAKVTQRLDDIKTLQTKVDSSSTEFGTIDIETISKYSAKGNEQMSFLEKHYHDTTNFDNAKYIDVYYANYKLMKKIVKGHKRLASEITYTQSQLGNLYLDVKNGLVADSVYTKYYSGEQKATAEIVKSVETLKEWETRSIKRYNGMVQPVDSIITELQKQGYR